jgi:hypothetical protein
MRRVSVKRGFERWRCEQCGAERTIPSERIQLDPRIAKPQ